MGSSKQIEDEAARWLIRRDSESWAPADDAQLTAWLSSSLANRVAYLRLEAAWEEARRLQALGAGVPSGVVPPSAGEWHVSPFFDPPPAITEQDRTVAARSPRFKMLAALAASILCAVALGVYLHTAPSGDRYATPIGGVASIPLQDGSNVILNTASRIHVVLTDEERLVELEGGEAFFEVAKDAVRPFVVEAGDKRIVAVGTQFSVRRTGKDLKAGEVKVIVTEGKVRFETPRGVPLGARPMGSGAPVAPLLAAGAIAHTSNEKLMVQQSTPREAEEALSWRTGYLTFDTIPLADAIAEFNRYTSRKILIEDPTVAALNVSGKFRATNADAFIRVLHDGFGIRVEESGDKVMLSR